MIREGKRKNAVIVQKTIQKWIVVHFVQNVLRSNPLIIICREMRKHRKFEKIECLCEKPIPENVLESIDQKRYDRLVELKHENKLSEPAVSIDLAKCYNCDQKIKDGEEIMMLCNHIFCNNCLKKILADSTEKREVAKCKCGVPLDEGPLESALKNDFNEYIRALDEVNIKRPLQDSK